MVLVWEIRGDMGIQVAGALLSDDAIENEMTVG
jgi:hypothetical protein